MKKFQKNIDKKKLRIFGIIPARMAASRFPGKPLKKICNIPMIEHVFLRARMFGFWDKLVIATCDQEIKKFSESKNFPVILTSKKHKRCLDRVQEAVTKLSKNLNIKDNDLVICVQGDEPMLNYKMIDNCVKPFYKNNKIKCTVLAMDIISKDQYLDPNIVKIVHDLNDEVLYTSRSPVPYSKKFSNSIMAKRIYGIFAFKWKYLKEFTKTKESFLERIESCDSNRICDNGRGQYIARQRYIDSFSVDCYSDLKKVEKFMKKDKFFSKYYKNASK
tara:strand:- start:80 stop:904 length:825 start_codon:yes stop_codon:yes gene_type:complete